MLPKIVTPEHEITLPSSKQKIKIRPFLVKEEKILLLAMESGEIDDITNAVKQIIQNCILTLNVDVDKLSPVDIEWTFLQLRKRSISNEFELGLKHQKIGDEEPKCKHVTKKTIKVDDIKYMVPEGHTNKIMVTDTVGITMNYPSNDVTKTIDSENRVELIFQLILKCIDTIFDSKNVTMAKDVPPKDLDDWINTFNQEQFNKIFEFFKTMPYLYYSVNYTCDECKKEESYEIKGLINFFT